ncbi:MAG: hypothetical protein IME96_09440 [Proteobacteria bacterium]|nr:hypothetical protein [Pseudomonadota bacterium]
MKKSLVVMVMLTMILTTSLPAFAGGGQMRNALQDAWYGGLLGGLVGGAALIFREDPEDHLEYIAYGFGAGVILGTAYNLASSSGALAEVEDGKVIIGMPTPKTAIVVAGDHKALQVSTDLVRLRF